MIRVSDVIAEKYRIEGILGTGGMGVVFAATHLDLDRLVAVKVMRSEMIEHPSAVQRLLLEAKLAARFKSEHVCKVLDVGTMPDGAPYIVMEYLEGADLATLLDSNGALDIVTAVDFMLEACEALAEAHASGIIHRDLKPENLFAASQVDGSSSIKVLDFGISKQVGAGRSNSRALTNPSSALGSPFYMAPEQMRSAKDVDTRTDLWAIGTILFELLTGRQVFEGETLPEVCAAVLGDEPRRATELRPDIPEGLDDVIARCLEKDADRRFQTVLELSEGLAPFGSGGAQESLLRIRRLGSTPPKVGARAATLPALSSPARPRLTPSTRLTPNTVRERPGARTSEQPAHQRGRSLPWIGALAACGLALVGAAVLASTRKTSPEHTSSDAPNAALHQDAPVAAKVAVAMPPVSEQTPSEPPSSDAIAPVDAATDATVVARPSSKGLTLHRRRSAPVPVASPVSALPPSPPAASTPKHSTTEAWNPESFGSRR